MEKTKIFKIKTDRGSTPAISKIKKYSAKILVTLSAIILALGFSLFLLAQPAYAQFSCDSGTFAAGASFRWWDFIKYL